MAVKPPRSKLGDADATRARILQEAMALLRRHGSGKLTVSDIAAACAMSHSNIYRFFPTKAAIYGALVEDWFADVERALQDIIDSDADPATKLRAHVLTLLRLKRAKIAADRDFYIACLEAAVHCQPQIARHAQRLRDNLRRIVADGLAAGLFKGDADALAQAVELATWRFRHPRLILEHADEPAELQAEIVVDLLLDGLRLHKN
jgi:AcrR family transcriptional regulator